MTEHLRELLREAASDPEPLRPQDIARRMLHRRRVRAGMAAACSAIAMTAIVVPLAAVHPDGHRAEITVASPSTEVPGPLAGFAPAKTISVAGKVVPFVGIIPWSDAVAATPEATTLTVFADTGQRLCGYTAERVEVRQATDSVAVLVAGYAAPIPLGVACTAERKSGTLLSVSLRAPLGNRRLIDAYDQVSHSVLISSTVPTLSGVEPGYEEQPISWNEATGAVNRTWVKAAPPHSGPDALITLTRAPTGLLKPPTGSSGGTLVATGVPVATGGARGTARVWNYAYAGGQFVTVLWTGADGFRYQLSTATPPAASLGVPQTETLARSVH